MDLMSRAGRCLRAVNVVVFTLNRSPSVLLGKYGIQKVCVINVTLKSTGSLCLRKGAFWTV